MISREQFQRSLIFLGIALGISLLLPACASTSSESLGFVKTAHSGDVITVRTTAYTHSEADHLQYGRKTALGTRLRNGAVKSAASDWSRIPVGTRFKIVDTGEVYEVDDYGSALVGTNTIDLYKPSRSAMNRWGARHVDIKILQVGCYDRSHEVLSGRRKWHHCNTMASVIEKRRGNPPDPKRSRSAAKEEESTPESDSTAGVTDTDSNEA